MTYAAATAPAATLDSQTISSKATISSITSADLEQLYEKMKVYIGTTTPSEINIDELETRMAKSTKEIQEVRDQLDNTVASITARVDTLSADIKLHTDQMASEIKRQNIIIIGMQQQFQDSMLDFSKKLQDIYNRSGTTIQSIPPTTTTSDQRRRGDGNK
jgi:FtsZ-binding cell division protein ZapB